MTRSFCERESPRLERELAKKPQQPDPKELEGMLDSARRRGLVDGCAKALNDISREISVPQCQQQLESALAGLKALQKALSKTPHAIPQAPTSHDEAMAMWRGALRSGAFRMLEAVVAAGNGGISRDAIADAVSMEKTGGTFSTYLGDLRRNGLITERNGIAIANDILFP